MTMDFEFNPLVIVSSHFAAKTCDPWDPSPFQIHNILFYILPDFYFFVNLKKAKFITIFIHIKK